MMMKTILLLRVVAEAFVMPRGRPITMLRANDYDETLAGIQQEYKVLQEKLLRDIVLTNDYADAEEIEEQMVDKAAQAAAVLRYKEMKELGEAEKELAQAADDKQRAHALKEKVQREAAQAEHEAALLESIDEQYEDMERMRDQAVAHADHQLEQDYEILEFQSEYHEEMAEKKEQRAAQLLKQVQDYEARLEQVLKDMRAAKSGEPRQESIQAEAAKHQQFLDEIKAHVDSDEALLNLKQKKSIQQGWKEEATNVEELEHAVETDPDLMHIVEQKKHVRKDYMEKEAHKHDSLLDEIEHSIDTDPDLSNIAQKKEKTVKKTFMEKEAHKHDSLLDEVEHSIDTDPDLV